jgi:hypothetical protein
MRSTTRYIALGFAGIMLAACGHKDKDAPLAFVPADTPYVVANLDIMDDGTRDALLAQADAQLPAQLAQLDAAADQMAAKDPEGARLLHALSAEFKGKTIESFARGAGLNLKGYSAFYGLGLAPVMRFELSDTSAFDAFVGRLEAAYGKKLDAVSVDKQAYRKFAFAARKSCWRPWANRQSPRCCRPMPHQRCCARPSDWTVRRRACRMMVVLLH